MHNATFYEWYKHFKETYEDVEADSQAHINKRKYCQTNKVIFLYIFGIKPMAIFRL